MIAVISDNSKESIGLQLYEYLLENKLDVKFVPASGRNVKTCYGCSGCTYQTYGKCVVRDDMDEILPIIAKADTYVYTTPVVWGGLSYDIKKIIDKTAVLGNRFYTIRGKEIVKGFGKRGKKNKLVVLGVSDQLTEKARNSFVALVNEMGNIMDVNYLASIVSPGATKEKIEKIAKEVLAL